MRRQIVFYFLFLHILLMSQANTAEIGSYVIVEPDNQSSYMKGFPPPADKVIARFRDGLTEDQYRWAFQNMSKITSVEPVNRGSGGITVLPYSNGHLLDETFTAPDGKNQSLKSLLRMMKVDGFIVLKNGTIRTEAYYNGLTPHTHHIIFSVTKSMVGTLTGVLIDDAMVKRQNFASEYLPELQGSAMGQATVQQLLDMTASVEWNHDRSNNDSEVRLNSMAGNFTARPEEFPFSNTLEFIQSLKPKNEHGLNYVYNPANTEALGWIITRVKQRNWQDVFAEQIWSRLGAEHDLLLTVDPQGHGFATAGANATLRDLARFGLMLEQQGYFNGEQIISQTWVDDIRNGDEFAHAAFRQSPERRRLGHQAFYRNQFRVLNSQAGEFFALGAFGQMIYINMEQDIVGVFLSTNLARSASANQVSLIRQIADAIAVE